MSQEPDQVPPAPNETSTGQDPAAMSVDQLTQAFASLLGEDQRSGESVGEDVEAPEPSPALAGNEDDDSRRVTPESILEAILFVGHPQNEPLTSRMMASYLRGVSPQEVDALIAGLNDAYAQQQAPYEIVSHGAGYRLTLRSELLGVRDVFYGKVREARLTQAAIDLLAIVAYHQPLTRDAIERLRGQPSGAILAQLVRRQLLSVEYGAEKPRQKSYRTTERFLELFGLDSLEDLPSHEDF